MFKVRGRKVTDLEVFQKIDFMLCLKCTKIVNGVGWDLVKRLQKLRWDGMRNQIICSMIFARSKITL